MRRRTFLQSILAAPLLLGCSAITAPDRALATPRRRRVGVGCFEINNPENLRVLGELGITLTRTTLYWGNSLDTREFSLLDWRSPVAAGGVSVLGMLGQDLATLDAAGIDAVIVVHSPPVGMSYAEGLVEMPLYMAARAAQFPGRTWQIMNEMDGTGAFNGGNQDWFRADDTTATMRERGALYGRLLRDVYEAVKTADPSATVVCGGISVDGPTFWQGMLTTMSASHCDAVAVHCYGTPTIGQFVNNSRRMRALLGTKPLWCTEWGNRAADEIVQAIDIAACLGYNDREEAYDRAILFQLDDHVEGYGVIGPDGGLRRFAQLLADRNDP